MHLTPREQERLTIFTLAELARRRRARGRRLNAPESVALVCDEILELAWDGATLEEVIAGAKAVLGPDDVMDGVPALVTHVQVEALFPNGTALVAVDAPIGPAPQDGPGAVRTAGEPVEINPGRPRSTLRVTNEGPRTVFVSSHFPLGEVNAALAFDRDPSGLRLDIPAGTAGAFRPGESTEVEVIEA
ncbi:urease subunit gamma [Nonomuraea typhae]|uniref:urease subunit gamma n=1 Tax=Nonomuraea typhae TaxID=2603600 RepID=UPI0012F77D23|nr:urease subunit gamma [Nonomuraea typhae]